MAEILLSILYTTIAYLLFYLLMHALYLLLFRISVQPMALFAHGLQQEVDIAVPYQLYALGAGATVACSFIAIALLTSVAHAPVFPTIELTNYWWGRFIFTNAWPRRLVRISAFACCAIIILAGYYGNQLPSYNVAPVAIWVVFTIGMVYFSAVVGNIWYVLHPAASLLLLFKRGDKQLLVFPNWLQLWPAIIGYGVFRFIENVHPSAQEPRFVAQIVLVYMCISFFGMLLFGIQTWLRYADPFYVFFNFLAAVAMFTVAKHDAKKIMLRLPFSGLLDMQVLTQKAVYFEMLMLSVIAFDGVSQTAIWGTWRQSLPVMQTGITGDIVAMLLLFALFYATYAVTCFAIKRFIATSYTTHDLMLAFAFSLLPIAVSYEVSHFVTLFLLEGQRALYLLSDPFALNWNLFGTADGEINYNALNFVYIWYFQVACIVLGHVVAVYVSHVRALQLFASQQLAIKSQYPLLLLMVFYTIFSLWILGQPLAS